ncbi:MAG: hypothetical protein WCC10_07930 [Tumebacillaceae bacterium]
MKTIVKIAVVAVALSTSFVAAGSAYAAPTGQVVDYTKQKVTPVSNAKQLAKKFGLDPNKAVGAVRVENTAKPVSKAGVISPEWGDGYYLTNIAMSETYGNHVKMTEVMGPSDYTMTIGTTVTATWSSNAGISEAGLSAQLGFSVAAAYNVSDQYKVTVPAGHTYRVYAFPILEQYNFDVWYDPFVGSDYYAGYGWAKKPTGNVYFYWEEL